MLKHQGPDARGPCNRLRGSVLPACLLALAPGSRVGRSDEHSLSSRPRMSLASYIIGHICNKFRAVNKYCFSLLFFLLLSFVRSGTSRRTLGGKACWPPGRVAVPRALRCSSPATPCSAQCSAFCSLSKSSYFAAHFFGGAALPKSASPLSLSGYRWISFPSSYVFFSFRFVSFVMCAVPEC